METIDVVFSDDAYDMLVHSGIPNGNDLAFAVKDRATKAGSPGVCVAFSALVHGERVQVQATTTARCIIAAARAIEARYPNLMV